MFMKFFVATAIMIASTAFVSAQDIFFSFSPTAANPTSTLNVFDDPPSGSAYIFSDGLYALDSIEILFTTSDSDVIRFTGGEAFNPMLSLVGGTRFNSGSLFVDSEGSSGRLLLVNITENGVNPNLSSLHDPGFDAGIGPNGAVLLARVDFELVGSGTADLEMVLGPLGGLELPNIVLAPSFGSATLDVIIEGGKLGFCTGDVNRSGTIENGFTDGVDFLDIAPFIAILSSRTFQVEADCNFDGVVNFLDIAPFLVILASS